MTKISIILADLQQRKKTCETDYFGLIEEAKEVLEKYNDGLVEMDMPQETLAELYYLIAHMMMASYGDPDLDLDEAAQYLNEAIRLQDLEKYTLELQNVLASNREHEDGDLEAIAALDGFIERTGGTAKTLASAGNMVLMYTEDLEKGVDYFHRAIEMEPERVDTYWTYFIDLEEIVEEYPEYVEDAILCLTRIIEICSRPKSSENEYEGDEYEDGYDEYEYGDDEDINIPCRYLDLAKMYYKIENYEKALECVNHYLATEPDDEQNLRFKEDILQKLK